MGLRPCEIVTPAEDQTGLGSWYVHKFTALRRKHLIFMSERTVLSFVLCGLRKSHCPHLPSMFLAGLSQLLTQEEIPSDQIERVLDGYRRFGFANTDSRVSLGVMNDLVYHYRYSIARDGDISETIRAINRIPQRTINWNNPVEQACRILAEDAN